MVVLEHLENEKNMVAEIHNIEIEREINTEIDRKMDGWIDR